MSNRPAPASGLSSGIVVIWALALGGAAFFGFVIANVIGIVPGVPILLSYGVSFVIAAVVCGGWALRTSVDMAAADRVGSRAMREPWPADAMRAGLQAHGWLTRTGQPGQSIIASEFLDADLQLGAKTARSLTIEGGPCELVLVVRASIGSYAQCVDVSGTPHVVALAGGQPVRVTLPPGPYRVEVVAQTADRSIPHGIVRAWWLTRPAAAGSTATTGSQRAA